MEQIKQKTHALYADRLNSCLEELGYPRRGKTLKIQQDFGWTTSQAQKVLAGVQPLTWEMCVSLVEKTSINLNYLCTGHGPRFHKKSDQKIESRVKVMTAIMNQANLKNIFLTATQAKTAGNYFTKQFEKTGMIDKENISDYLEALKK